MIECRIPNQYYYGFDSTKHIVFLSKEVVEFIQKYKLQVIFQDQNYSPINAEENIIYRVVCNGPYTNSSSIILIKGEDKNIITLFRMTF